MLLFIWTLTTFNLAYFAYVAEITEKNFLLF